jgi:hypothetical protein
MVEYCYTKIAASQGFADCKDYAAARSAASEAIRAANDSNDSALIKACVDNAWDIMVLDIFDVE